MLGWCRRTESHAQDQVASSWNIFHIQSLTLGRDMEAVSCSFPTSFISLGEVFWAGMAIRPPNSTTYSCRVSVLPEPSVGVIHHLVAPGSEVLSWQGLHESSHGQMRMSVFNCEVLEHLYRRNSFLSPFSTPWALPKLLRHNSSVR